MTFATTNPGGTPSGSDSAAPSTDLNDPSNLNFVDSDEDEQNNQEVSDQGIEGETDEPSEDGQEADETATDDTEEDPDEQEGEEPAVAEKSKDVVVTLKGGEQVPLEELKSGYMRDRDYRRKTQEVANKSKSLDEMANRVTSTVDAFASHLASMLPDEPSHTLAIQNPQEYTRQKAIYDSALAQVNKIISLANEPKTVKNTLSEQQQREALAAENAKLIEAFPQTAKEEGRKRFFNDAFQTARDFGFSDEEMRDITDHRMFKLAHYARLGMQAETARTKALSKVNNAPPAVANGKSKGVASQKARANQDAMKKLAKTGSIKDAMAIDFD
jgi:hypothetical protein